MRAFDYAVGEGCQADEDEGLADGIEGAGAGGFRFRDEQCGEDGGGDADGDVDPEDGAPADGFCERSADERADAERETCYCAPDAYGAGAVPGRREGIRDDGERDGVEHGCAEALECAEGDELLNGGCAAAEERTEDEDGEADLKDSAAAEAV